MRKIDLLGMKFGRLTVRKEAPKRGKFICWECDCDCGNTAIVTTRDLRNGDTKSCGCLAQENRSACHVTHGQADTRLYFIWQNMKHRCNLENNVEYFRYGGRGIKVCKEWEHDFGAFSTWAYENGYEPLAPRGECTIDRINNDAGYSPDNCRWVSMKEQCKNRRHGNAYKRSYAANGSIIIQ